MKTPLNKVWIYSIILLLSGVLGFIFYSYTHRDLNYSPNDVQTIQTFHYPSTFVNQIKGDPEAGRKIFREFCTTCHGNPPTIDIRAPHIGDSSAWKSRRQLGLNLLLKITIHGTGAMPARGGCFECSDEQLLETIRYILKNSQG